MANQVKYERLPKNVLPQHYNIHLMPDLQKFIFNGKINIDIVVTEETNQIILNSLNLDFTSVILEQKNQQLTPENVKFLTDEEKAVIKFRNNVTPGDYNLQIKYTGKLEDNMKGFYRSKYVDDKGKEYFSAITQFAPADARRCFPCWDEPAIKATFDVALTAKKDLIALSNTVVTKSTAVNDDVTYYFERTPKMSTYLAAFIIGHFDFVETQTPDGVLIRVYTPLGKQYQGQFALEVAAKVLPYYEHYFNIAYPLPKLDLIAVASLSYNAMENWGLITYRENQVLIDPDNSSTANKQSVTIVVAHEIAHQWFGNLVTMKWWTDLWLNEGYATFSQFLCTSYLYPEYNIWAQFVSTYFLSALELDSLKNSHPIEVNVQNPSEINQIFDAVTYNKGASIIRMLVDFIGDEKFREGMSLYLKRNQYGNTATKDLWDALEEASNSPVTKIMSTWTEQMGFPLITIQTSDVPEGVKVKLSQTKFTVDGSPGDDNYLWLVPITLLYSTSSGTDIKKLLLSTKSTEFVIPNITSANWIKLNAGVVGFYRTLYSNEMLEKFKDAIKNKELSSLDRLGLLEDLFALVKAGHSDTVTLLEFLTIYKKENDSNVWISVINILNKLSLIFDYTDYKILFKNYRKQLFNDIYKSIGWNPRPQDTHIDVLLRSSVLDHFSYLNDEDMIKESKLRFSRHLSGQKVIPADIRLGCYKSIIIDGGDKEFETLLQLYKATDLNEEKLRITKALGCTSNPDLITKLLNLALSDQVKTQDSVLVLIAAAQTPVGRNLTWNLIKTNWKSLCSRFTAGSLLQRLITLVTQNFTTEEQRSDVERFFADNTNSWIDRSVHQVLENVAVNVAWLKKDSASVRKYLESYK